MKKVLVTTLALSSLPFGVVTGVPAASSSGASSSGAPSGSQHLAAPAPPPRLILTTKGIVTPELKASFSELLREATPDGVEQPLIAVVITAMLAPGQKPKNQQQAMAAKAAADALAAAGGGGGGGGTSGGAQPLSSDAATSRPEAGSTLNQSAAERAALSAAAAVAADEVVAEAGLPARVRVIDVSRDSREQMEAVLAEASCTFVLGGNTFYLMHWMRESGFDALVRRRVSEGMLYVGSSAGAIVAGQSISTAYWKGWDDPKAATDLGADFQDPRALALVPGHSFFPHHLPEWEETVEQRKSDLGHSLITLREDCGCGCYVSGRGRSRAGDAAAAAVAAAAVAAAAAAAAAHAPPAPQPLDAHGDASHAAAAEEHGIEQQLQSVSVGSGVSSSSGGSALDTATGHASHQGA